MQEELKLTGPEIAASIVMEQQQDPRLVIIVEGKEDMALLRIHLDSQVCRVVIGYSKSAVLAAASYLQALPNVRCVVDADLDLLLGLEKEWPSNVIYSEYYDLLMDCVLASPALLRNALVSHLGDGRLGGLDELSGDEALRTLIRIVQYPGGLRLLSKRGEVVVRCQDWSFRGLADGGDLFQSEFHLNQANLRMGGRADLEQLRASLSGVLKSVDGARLVTSHDLTKAVSDICADYGYGSVHKRALEATLRAAISCAEFVKTRTVQCLLQWADEVVDQALLRCELAA